MTSDPFATREETDRCPSCGADLAFTTDGNGQTLEACPTRGCPYHWPHRPRPTTTEDPMKPTKKRGPRPY